MIIQKAKELFEITKQNEIEVNLRMTCPSEGWYQKLSKEVQDIGFLYSSIMWDGKSDLDIEGTPFNAWLEYDVRDRLYSLFIISEV